MKKKFDGSKYISKRKAYRAIKKYNSHGSIPTRLSNSSKSKISFGTKVNNASGGTYNVFIYLLVIIVFILLISFVFRYSSGRDPLTFTSFLHYLSNAPAFTSFTTVIDIFQISGEWVILDGLRVFINYLGTVLGVLVFLFVNLLNSLSFVLYFVNFLFV